MKTTRSAVNDSHLKSDAWRLGLRLSSLNGMYDILEYNDSIDTWQPIGWRWANSDWSLTAGCVQEILNELR